MRTINFEMSVYGAEILHSAPMKIVLVQEKSSTLKECPLNSLRQSCDPAVLGSGCPVHHSLHDSVTIAPESAHL